eukprot:jgi/Tetstr1/446725/TSEL_034213.t1
MLISASGIAGTVVLLGAVASMAAPRCLPQTTAAWLARAGVSLSPGLIVCETAGMNRVQLRVGQRRRFALRRWFCLGVPAAAACALAMLGLLVQEAAGLVAMGILKCGCAVQARHGRPLLGRLLPLRDQQAPISTGAVPRRGAAERRCSSRYPAGACPGSDVPWLLASVLLAVLLHEAGHALAAGAEGVPMSATGFFLAGGLVPGAYVSLDGQALAQLPPPAQLRVVCAGVWHNAVTAGLAAAALQALPVLLAVGWESGTGAVVESIASVSPLAAQLRPGSVLTSLDDCPVTDSATFRACVRQAYVPPGASAAGSLVPRHVLDGADPCRPEAGGTVSCTEAQHLCFTELPGPTGQCPGGCEARCLRARRVKAMPGCTSSSAGRNNVSTDDGHGAPTLCMAADLPRGERLLSLHLSGDDNTAAAATAQRARGNVVPGTEDSGSSSVLYAGPAAGLSEAFLRLGDYKARLRWLPVWLPRATDAALFYLQCVSASMALVNMAPAHGLDGAPALRAATAWMLSLRRRRQRQPAVLPDHHRAANAQFVHRAVQMWISSTTAVLAAVLTHKVYAQLLRPAITVSR